MIGVYDIKKALVAMLKKNFNIKVSSKVVEDFPKPTFFTDFNIISQKRLSPILYRKNIRIRVIYFTNKGNIDVLKTLDKLDAVFNYKFAVLNRQLDILDSEYEIDVENEYLIYTFRLDFIDRRIIERADNMQDVMIDSSMENFEIKEDFK